MSNSEITDNALVWISRCRQLEVVDLFDNRGVSPAGYAQLLRSNPRLRSLGRCDIMGQVVEALYHRNSNYRR